jgi:hypothetical protein
MREILSARPATLAQTFADLRLHVCIRHATAPGVSLARPFREIASTTCHTRGSLVILKPSGTTTGSGRRDAIFCDIDFPLTYKHSFTA